MQHSDPYNPATRKTPPPRTGGRGQANDYAGVECTTTLPALTVAQLARLYRDAMRDKTYQLYPLGMLAAGYLRQKRKHLTKDSRRKYESALDKLARYYPDLEPKDFEPPVGTLRLEEFMDAQWGDLEPRTYNSNLSPIRDFFKWLVAQGELVGNPTLTITRAKPRTPHRETYSRTALETIIAAQTDLRDRIVLMLMLHYALRKGEIRACQFRHFDHIHRRIKVFGKGGTIAPVPIPDPTFWLDLERLILDTQAQPDHYLLPGRRGNRHGSTLLPHKPISAHAQHKWWYRRLADAGIVPTGTTSGERMHKARHTAGQTVLDETGNLVAVNRLLRHKSVSTTADIYLDWDLDQLARTLANIYTDPPNPDS